MYSGAMPTYFASACNAGWALTRPPRTDHAVHEWAPRRSILPRAESLGKRCDAYSACGGDRRLGAALQGDVHGDVRRREHAIHPAADERQRDAAEVLAVQEADATGSEILDHEVVLAAEDDAFE